MDNRQITVREIQRVVADRFDVSLSEMKSHCRRRDMVEARQVAMRLCREMTNLSLPAIAARFNRDHTTVWHGIRRAESLDDRGAARILAAGVTGHGDP